MNRDLNRNALTAALLAFLISLGGLACMVTGLKLEVTGIWLLALACAGASVLGAACYRFPKGGWILRGLTVLWLILAVWKPETVTDYMDQLRTMLHRMTWLWNNAYGWGVIPPGESAVADQPLMVIGFFVALAVCRTVCCRKRPFFPVFLGLLPLWSCLVVTDTLPGLIWLFCLLLGIGVLLMTDLVRRANVRQGLKVFRYALPTVAFALVMAFLGCPPESYVNNTARVQEVLANWAQDLPATLREWGQKTAVGDTQPVQTHRENLSTLGDRVLRNTPVLYVTAQRDGTLYLRGQDFDSYDGKTWSATRNRAEEFSVGVLPELLWEETGYTVTVTTPNSKSIRYVPYHPQAAVNLVGGRLENNENMRTYSYILRQPEENWQELLRSISGTYQEFEGDFVYAVGTDQPVSGSDLRYRVLPLETEKQAREILSRFLPDGAGNGAADIAEAIGDYVRSSAIYSLTPEKMPGDAEDFALWFLEEADRGYCVHFATAATVLLRAAGIDARYVTGYILETHAGQTVTVPQAQAHAWVEYFEPRLGTWLVLEATPGDLTAMQPEPSAPTETEAVTEPERTEPLPTETPGEKPSQPSAVRPQPGKPEVPEKKGNVSWLKWAVIFLLAAAGVWLQRRLRWKFRRRGLNDPDPNVQALALWQETELLYRLRKQAPPEELEQLAEKAKFSQYALSREEVEVFRRELEEGQKELHSAPWYRKMVYRYWFAAW